MEGEFSMRFLVHVNCYSVTTEYKDVTAQFLIVEAIPPIGS